MHIQFLKFVLVGTTSTIVTLAVLTGLVEWGKLDPVLSSIVGYVLGTIVNYILNFKITFIASKRHSTVFSKFILIVFSGLIANTVLMFTGVHIFSIPYIISQLFAVGIVMVWSFATYKYWVFAD